MRIYYWIIFILYLGAMLYIGYIGMKRSKTADDYFVAGRSLNLFVSALLFSATFITAGTMVGYAGSAYNNGWFLTAQYCIGLLGSMISLQLFSRKFYNAKATWYTTADYFCQRFEEHKFMRTVFPGYLILNALMYMMIGIMGIGTVLEVFLGIPYTWGIIIIGTTFVIYTVTGGQFAVAWTNVAQGILLFLAMVITAIWGVNEAGGLSNINAQIATINDGIMHSFTKNGQYPIYKQVGTWLNLMMSVPCLAYYQRVFFTLKSKRTARSLIGASTVFIGIVYYVVVLIGISGRVLIPNIGEPNSVFPTMVTMMSPIFAGVAVAGIIAAIQSSIDGQLLSVGTMFTQDIYANVINKDASEEQMKKVARIAMSLFGLIVIVLGALKITAMMTLYDFMVAMGATTVFPAMLLGLFWERTTKQAAIFGITFGGLGGLLWYFFGIKSLPGSLVIVPITLIGMVIISLNTKPNSNEALSYFFDMDKQKS